MGRRPRAIKGWRETDRLRRRRRRNRRKRRSIINGRTDRPTDRQADRQTVGGASQPLQPDTEAADPAADTESWPLKPPDPRPAPAPASCSRSARSPTCRWTRYALHFLVQSGLTYGIMILTGVEHMHKYCLLVALSYLSLCQITRVYVFDYGMYSADFTGPMMVITQKITSVAFEVHDGMARNEEHLTPGQKILAIRRMPSLLEYFSYNCNFMGILAGPTSSYNDYIAFIEGDPLRHRDQEGDRKANSKLRQSEPSPNVVYLYLSMLTTRPKYYFVWTLADAINNAAGFGFSGYNKDGSPRWDRISNLRILNIELATSFKVFLDNWNIQTAHWLKRVCYERCPYHPTAATFILSAMWHGAYPGYYLTFLTGIVITLAARAVRHNVRPYFLQSSSYKLVYDVITWAATQIAICYTVVPFVLLSVGPSIKFYRSWYFSLHIGCILLAVALPVKPKHLRLKDQQQNLLQETLQHHLEATDSCSKKEKNT
uniref:lysophospholipid acyltransferase 2b isoform X3 n=1 Tax=Scatophagus argus TaxID=75038 RepID=UPI001ED86205|nr:lysophospholipid acyltransferase 2b isoform X3 [Scatophagus argus]